MKVNEINVKTVLAIYIVMFGMFALIFMEPKETTENSIVNLMLIVIAYHFGSSSGSAAKDKLIADNNIKTEA